MKKKADKAGENHNTEATPPARRAVRYPIWDESNMPSSRVQEAAIAYPARDFRPAIARIFREMPALEAVRLLTSVAQEEFASHPAPQARLAMAEMRGLQAREEMKQEEGGSLSAEDAGAALGISKPAILKRYHKGQALGWREARQKSVRFPAWQFTAGGTLPGLEQVLAVFQEAPWVDDWTRISFFLNRLESLGAKRPLDLLRKGDIQRVVWAAQATIE